VVEHGVVDVRRVDAGAVVEPLLAEDDREREGLLPGRAARVPDPHERIGPQERHDLLAERGEERRVAEHRRDVDRQVEEQPLHRRGIVEDLLLERRQRRHSLGAGAAPQPPLERRPRVAAKVEPVVLVDALEEQARLDPLEIRTRAGELGHGHVRVYR
jgi:hypothetical protein